jgi:LacI family transcriptional regulator
VYDATSQLLRLGHRRIAALAGRADSFRTTQRLSGFRGALAEQGIDEVPELVVTGLRTSDEARGVACRMLDGADAPTAMLALNLGISTGVLLDRIANHREVAFIALDETELTVGLGISAVSRDPQEVGRQAAQLAIKRIASPDTPARTITLPSKLVRRGSGELAPSNGSPQWPRAQ